MDVVSGFQQMGGKAVAQRVQAFARFNSGFFTGFLVDAAHGIVG